MSLIDKTLFTRLEQGADRTVSLQGKSYLFFGGTAYLGLPRHPEFIRLYQEGMARFGVNVGSSRNNNVQLGIYPEAEAWAAARFSAEDAMLMSSGFLAAQLCIRRLSARIPKVYYAPESHPAILSDHAKVGSGSFADWVKETVQDINTHQDTEFLIVSNTLNSLKPERFDFSAFKAVDPGKKVHFLLDDSHGIGITGKGKGSMHFGVPTRANFKTTIIASLAKGLSIDAGLILSDKATLSDFRSSSLYSGASPSAPAAAYTLMHAGSLYDARLERLRENQKLLLELLQVPHVSIPEFPVYFMEMPELGDLLMEKDIIISSFSYPRPSDPPFNRVVLSSAHTAPDIKTLCGVINRAFEIKTKSSTILN